MTQATLTREGGGFGLSGDLTVKTARRLFDQTPPFAPGEMRINLAAVGEADSAGLALLVHWSNLAGSSSTKLVFTDAPAQLRQLAKISGLGELLDVGDDNEL